MKQDDDAAGDAGHGDSPRQDSQRPSHEDARDTGGQESRNDTIPKTQSRPGARPAGAPPAPGTLHADPPLPVKGRQPQRPGQVGREEERPGERDDETLKPSDQDR
jgi:hypothetical protein